MKKTIFLTSLLFANGLLAGDPIEQKKTESKKETKKSSKPMSIWQYMDKMHEDMTQEMKQLHEEMGTFAESKIKIKKTEFKTDEDNVIVKMDLELKDSNLAKDTKIAENEIKVNISTREDNLDGKITFANQNLNFFVRDGRLFSINSSAEEKKEQEKDGKYSSYSSFSQTKTLSLPEIVGNLETVQKATIKRKVKDANTLNVSVEIKLPKANSRSDWKKIPVETMAD